LAVRLGLTAVVEGEACAVVLGGGAYPQEVAPFVAGADAIVVNYEEELWPRWSHEVLDFHRALVLVGAPAGLSVADTHPPTTIPPRSSGTGYLSFDASGEEIVYAGLAASKGLVVYDATTQPSAERVATAFEDPTPMTTRELEILQLMADGLPNKQIALRLRISIHTVKFHVGAILEKLGAASRTEAVTLGMRQGHIRL
jgi:DNA-binding CsgD family transcriptional regulator